MAKMESTKENEPDKKSGLREEPTLFVDVLDMAISSIHSFVVADVRRMARQQKQQYQQQKASQDKPSGLKLSLEDCNALLELPLVSPEFGRLWEKNAAVFEHNLNLISGLASGAPHKMKTRDFFTCVLDKYIEKLESMRTADGTTDSSESYSWDKVSDQRSVHYVGDENESAEAVHAIYVDAFFRRIVLTFRGSITTKDWIQDSQLIMSNSHNPLYRNQDDHLQDDITRQRYLGVHKGFRDYMYGEEKSSLLTKILPSSVVETLTTPPRLPSLQDILGRRDTEANLADETSEAEIEAEKKDDEDVQAPHFKQSKIQIILDQLRMLQEEYPDFRIMVTGHSLGGALALIAALEVASDPTLSCGKMPVTCITFGNPKVGNKHFASAIEYLERSDRLRCLCIHNFGDLVPMVQSNAMRLPGAFWHVGFRTLVYTDGLELGRADAQTPLVSHRNNSHSSRSSLWDYLPFGKKQTTKTKSEEDDCSQLQQDDDQGKKSALFQRSAWALPSSDWESMMTLPKSGSHSGNKEGSLSQSHQQHQRQVRINMHNYREYVDRLLNLEPVLSNLSFPQLYELERTSTAKR